MANTDHYPVDPAITILERLTLDKRCGVDPLNPCFDNRPTDVMGRHWGGESACAICTALAYLASANANPVPGGVWEALQRLIENGGSLGPASQEDALLVAEYRQQLIGPRAITASDTGTLALGHLIDAIQKVRPNACNCSWNPDGHAEDCPFWDLAKGPVPTRIGAGWRSGQADDDRIIADYARCLSLMGCELDVGEDVRRQLS
jgi:hypothetical protein